MTNYSRGAQFEYEIKHYFERQGHYVIRSAGSHGVADLSVTNNKGTDFVQCKVLGQRGNVNYCITSVLKELNSTKIPMHSIGLFVKCKRKVWVAMLVKEFNGNWVQGNSTLEVKL
jgi:Holliday junction resolvase